MAVYDDLTTEDKAVVDNFTNVLRAACGETARLLNHLQAIDNDANAFAIFGTLDSGAEVPNRTGLAGADSMTKAELAAVWIVLDNLLAIDTGANRQAWTKAAGINSMLG